MVAPARVIGRYALYDEMAAGGMATVHFGRMLGPVGFSRTVAIKRLHPQFAKDSEFVAMFLDEARIAARIRHPNVVPTLDVVATEGELFLVMEYVEGESLSRLTRRRQTPPRIVASVMCGVLHGLHAAHEATDERGDRLDIVHRDVSPHNVLVGTDGIARVLDFGVAKAQGRAQTTRQGQIKGKLPYMAPEQFRGSVTRQTDIYAASIVTWEALVGRRLFAGADEMETLGKVLAGESIAPSKLAPEVPASFDDVVMRGLSVDPSKRWTTAREMALALEKCVGVASPSEVGDWVESTAREAISQRSHAITCIESSSQPSLVEPPIAQHTAVLPNPIEPQAPPGSSPAPQSVPFATALQADGPASVTKPPTSSSGFDLSSVSVAASTSPGAAPRGSKRALVLALALLSAGALVVLFVVAPWRTHEVAGPVPAGVSAAPSQATEPPPSASAPVPSLTVTATASASAAAPEPSGSASATTSPPRATAAPAHTARPAAPPPAKPRANASCEPPYTVDAQGHRHYKMECL